MAMNPGTTNPWAPPVALAPIELPVAEALEFPDPKPALTPDPLALALPEVFAPALPLAVVVAEADPVLEEEEADEVIARKFTLSAHFSAIEHFT